MRIWKNFLFLVWMVGSLLSISKFGKAIDRYRREGNTDRERETIREVAAYWAPKVLAHFRVVSHAEGLDRVPEGPALFVSNHQGYGDIFMFLAIIPNNNKQVGFIAKESLRRIPMFGKWVMRVRSLFLVRNDPRSAIDVFRRGAEWLGEGFSLVIFPEGTRSRGETMGYFKKGSLRSAVTAGAPIVPVSISGSWRLFEEKGYVRPGEVRFHVHPAIETKDLTKAEKAELSGKVEGIIRSKIEEWNAAGATEAEKSSEGARRPTPAQAANKDD
jgi:1-acyl-sn-glycerol-3-phosphate acyltransferase